MNNPKEIGSVIYSYLCKEMEAVKNCESYDGKKLSQELNLSEFDINNGVEYLKQQNLIKVIFYKASPFNFGCVKLNQNGKQIYFDYKNNDVKQSIGY